MRCFLPCHNGFCKSLAMIADYCTLDFYLFYSIINNQPTHGREKYRPACRSGNVRELLLKSSEHLNAQKLQHAKFITYKIYRLSFCCLSILFAEEQVNPKYTNHLILMTLGLTNVIILLIYQIGMVCTTLSICILTTDVIL